MSNRYEFSDPIFKRNTRYPSLSVALNNRSTILSILRIISGTLNCEDTYFNKKYKFRTNYIELPYSDNSIINQSTISDLFPEEVTLSDLNIFFRRSFQNTSFFKSIEVELTKCIIANKDESYIEAFIFLYRIIEGICYSIPLIYTSKATDFKSSYSSLKSFFSSNSKDGELSFFRKFISTVYADEDFFRSSIDLNLGVIDLEEIRREYFSVYKERVKRGNLMDETENEELNIGFVGFYDFIIEIRNRYFHFLQGSYHNNISSEEVQYPNLFFKPIINHGLNWVSILLFEIIKFDIGRSR